MLREPHQGRNLSSPFGDDAAFESHIMAPMKQPRGKIIIAPDLNVDARRTKKLPDMAIEREVRKWCCELRTMKHLMYVNRRACHTVGVFHSRLFG